MTTSPLPRTSLEPVCLAVARAIRYRRLAMGWSPNELADRTALSRQMISFIENHQRVPTIDVIARICRAFGVSVARLVAEAECVRRARGCNYSCIACKRLVVV